MNLADQIMTLFWAAALIEMLAFGVMMLLSFLVGYWLGGRRYRNQAEPSRQFERSLDVPRL